MQPFCVSVALLGIVARLVWAEEIIGADGKEHRYVGNRAHRDGLHDQALHQHHDTGFLHEEAQDRRYHLSHPRLRRWDYDHIPHMLNQAPIIVSQDSLNIVSGSHHIRRIGSGVSTGGIADKSPTPLAAATRNTAHGSQQDAPVLASKQDASSVDSDKDAPSVGSEQESSPIVESSTALNRMEQSKEDTLASESRWSREYEGVAEEDIRHTVKSDQNFHFRSGHKQTELNAAEDLTAEEVHRKGREKLDMKVEMNKAPDGLAPSGAPDPAAAPGAALAASPSAAPAGAPEEQRGSFSMDEASGAQEQGFSGDVVQHDDMKTMTKDWRGEYGPNSGLKDYRKICEAYPDNQWCHDRGYHASNLETGPPKSAAVRMSGGKSLAFGLVAVFCGLILVAAATSAG